MKTIRAAPRATRSSARRGAVGVRGSSSNSSADALPARKARVRRNGAAGSRRRGNGAATLAEQAYVRLEELITTLKLAPGASVSEGELARAVGMGRTPIREALHRLAREHLIRIIPRRGIVIAPIDVGAQMRLLELRRSVESMVAAAAARKASAEERAHFAELAERFV
ncbi:MAG TPA: GntR family transcriptional regulator, partial [Burkholderiaceae bacterium]|nr:GntR family transcriptional regulator [Burkholderiaceae bacterium]